MHVPSASQARLLQCRSLGNQNYNLNTWEAKNMAEVARALRTWIPDLAHSEVSFVARHMIVTKVRGTFDKYSAKLEIPDGSLIPASIVATIEVGSLSTRNEDRDAHLRSADFFDVLTHTVIHFKSESIDDTGQNDFDVTGLLTIRNVTKSVCIGVHAEALGKDPWGNERIGYEGSLRINREDFGLTWNQTLETGGVLVGKNVDIELNLQVIPEPVT
jgi:polyisoprenoid-binding protein YceI